MKNRFLRILSIAFIITASNFSNALTQTNNHWEYLTSGDRVTALATYGNTLWAGMTTGLAKVDLTTREVVIYNKLNSGLPINSVSSLALNPQTQELWIGTNGGGLAKFDGQQWVVFNETNSGLARDWINCLALSPSGAIWVGVFGDTVSVFDGNVWVNRRTPNGGASSGPYSLAVRNDEEVWVGTSGGLFRLKGNEWELFDENNSPMPNNWVRALHIDYTGKLWIGTGNGVATLQDTSWQVFHKAIINGMEDWLQISVITVDTSSGVAWFSGYGGLHSFDGSIWKRYFIAAGDLAFDGQGQLWIGGNGLQSFQQGVLEEIEVGNSPLPTDEIYGMEEDTAGVIWLATYQGLYRGNEAGWELAHYGWFDVLKKGKDGKIWAAGPVRGLYYSDGGQIVSFDPPGANSPRVTAVLAEADGTVWVGIVEDGIYRYGNGMWHHFPAVEFGADSQYYATAIGRGPDGNIWAGVGYGLYIYDGQNWYKSDNTAIPNSWLTDMTTDQNGNFWLSSSDWWTSLAKFDGANWTVFGKDQKLHGVYELEADYEGGVWAAAGALLHIQENGQYNFFTPFNSDFPDLWTNAVLARKSGDLWAAVGEGGGIAILHNAFTVKTQEAYTKEEAVSAQVFPNPAVTSFEVLINSDTGQNENLGFKLYNAEGQALRHNVFSGQRISVNRGDLPPGIYFWQISHADGGNLASGKIIFID